MTVEQILPTGNFLFLYAELLTSSHGGRRIPRVPSDRPTSKSSVSATGSGHATAHPERLLPSTPRSAAKHDIAACAVTAPTAEIPAPSFSDQRVQHLYG